MKNTEERCSNAMLICALCRSHVGIQYVLSATFFFQTDELVNGVTQDENKL